MLTKKQIIDRLKTEIYGSFASIQSNKIMTEKIDILTIIAESLPSYYKNDLDEIITELNLLLNLLFNKKEKSVFAKAKDFDSDALIDFSNALIKLELLFPNSRFTNDVKTMAVSINTMSLLDTYDITPEDEYLADLLSIANFLANKEECELFLAKLEEELQQSAITKSAKLADYKDELKQLADDEDKPFSKQKILSSFLYQWAIDNGYNKEKYTRVKGLLERNEFLALLIEQTILKDTGVDPEHGIWTHVIQQYLVAEKDKDAKKNTTQPFLAHSSADIYAYLGRKNNESTVSDDISTWDIIFDRNDSIDDYRKPENLQKTLNEDMNQLKTRNAKYPILSSSAVRYKQKPLDEEGMFSNKTYHFVYFQPAPKPVTVTDSESKQEEVSQYANGQLSG